MNTVSPPLKKYLITAFVLFSGLMTSSLYAQVEAIATCPATAVDSMYQIKVSGFTPATPYTIIIEGVEVESNEVQTGDYLSTNIAYLDGTDTVRVTVIEDPTGAAIEEEFLVHEIFCKDIDSDGDYDYATSECDYVTEGIDDRGAIISSVAPYLGENVYNYVLTDTFGVAQEVNTTGYFPGLSDGSYNVYAFTFLSAAEATQMRDSLTIGTTDLDNFSLTQPACFAFCGDIKGKTGSFYTIECELMVSVTLEDQEICEDGDVDFNSPSTITGIQPTGTSVAYEWLIDTIGPDFFVVAGATDSVLELTSVPYADNGDMYKAIAILSVNGVEIDRDTSATATLTVYESPTLAALMNMDTTVSTDSPIGVVLTDGSSTADSFDITAINVPALAGFSADGGNASTGGTNNSSIIAGDTYTNTTGSAVTVTYTVVPYDTVNDCEGDPVTITVMISPCPEVDAITATVCSDDMIAVQLPDLDKNGADIDSFSITANSTGATTGVVTDLSAIADDAYNNITSGDSTVIYTITPYAFGCQGSDFTVTITVKPEPEIENQTVSACSDEAIGVDLMVLTGYTGPPVDSFVVTATAGAGLTGSPSEGTFTSNDDLASDVFTNTGETSASVVYTVTPYADSCVGANYTITVNIVAEPVGSDPALETCGDEAFSISLQSLISNGITVDSFAWFIEPSNANSNLAGVPVDTSNATTLSGTLTNVSGSDQDLVYTVVPYMGTCGGDPFSVTVTVHPEPVFSALDTMFCSGESFSLDLGDLQTDGSSILGYNYTVNTPGTARTDTSSGNITATVENVTASDIVLTYVVTPITADTCSGDPFNVVVTVKPQPVLVATMDTVCSGSSVSYSFEYATVSITADSFDIISITDGGLTNNNATTPATVGRVSDASSISGDEWSNTGTSAVNVVYNVAPVSGDGCVGDAVNITVRVDPTTSVDAGSPYTLCSNYDLTLSELGASITGGTTSGEWETSGTGTFVDGSDAGDNSFNGAVTYKPSDADVRSGGVILTLNSDEVGKCPEESDTVAITINNVSCSEFPWTGN